jgi:Rps23 Pro-64 3,4-dihydroxylase Tpa1-like proline 4-hydroxylase
MYISPKPIYPTKIVGGCIAIYEDFWDKDLIDSTIETVEREAILENSGVVFRKSLTFADGELEKNGLPQTEKRTNFSISLSDSGKENESMRQINNIFFDKMLSAVEGYRIKFSIEEQLYAIERLSLLRYQYGQKYDAHYDGSTDTARCVSPVFYINDDYTGGEIEFIWHNVKIKPKAGTLVLFPSNYAYAHIAHPVRTGTKYAIVTFVRDRMGYSSADNT